MSDLIESCLAQWPMDDNYSCDHVFETLGAHALYDPGGAYPNFTSAYTAESKHANLGTSLKFNVLVAKGGDNNINAFVDLAERIDLSGSWTITWWMRAYPTSPGNMIAGYAGLTASVIFIWPNTKQFYFYSTDPMDSVSWTTTKVITETWRFCAMVSDGSNIELFIDNESEGAKAIDNTTWSLDRLVKGTAVGGIGSFSGRLDNVCVFDKALNSRELAHLWNSGNGTQDINFNFTPDTPAITSTADNEDQDSITVSVTGTDTITLYYRKLLTTSWTAGQTREGSGDIVQTGLDIATYEVYVTATYGDNESPPSGIRLATVAAAESQLTAGGFDSELVDVTEDILSEMGESVTYYPAIGGSREILAVVTRGRPGPVDGAPHGKAPTVRIAIKNDSTDGISSDEIDTGGDKIEVAVRIGETAQQLRITKILQQDAGMMVLELR